MIINYFASLAFHKQILKVSLTIITMLFLKNTNEKAIKKWVQYKKEFDIENEQCIQKNSQLIMLLSSFFYSFLSLPNYTFPILANICLNTKFVINKKHFKYLPSIKCSYDYIVFLRKKKKK